MAFTIAKNRAFVSLKNKQTSKQASPAQVRKSNAKIT